MIRKAFLALAALAFTTAVQAQNVTVMPYAAQAVADIGNGPIKLRVIQGNASIFTVQGSGTGSTSGSSTTLTLTGTPLTPPCVGCLLTGTGIIPGTRVTAYNGTTTITMSAAMTVPGGTAVSWGAACPADASGIPAAPNFIQGQVSSDFYLMYTLARICAISPGGPANTLLTQPVFYDSTTPGGGGGGGIPDAPNDGQQYGRQSLAWTVITPSGTSFANPTATAGPTAVNGVAGTAMRSDAAPAVRLASAVQSGLMPQWSGTTTTFFRGDGTFTTVPISAVAGLGTGVATALGVNIGSAGSMILQGTSAGGDLTGTYPNPTVGNNAITYGKIQQVAASSLVGNPTGVLANAQGITLDSTLGFTGTVLGCTTATAGQIGCSRPDGTTITASGGILTAIGGAATSIAVGTTTVSAGTNTRVLFNNAAVLGEYSISGTGNVAMTTNPVFTTPNLGTPSAVVLTNGTGCDISTCVSGLGTGVATFLGTPSSANLAAAVTGETGSGALVFATSPTLTTPALGTPSSVTLTNGTGLPISTGVSGLGTGVATALAVNTPGNGAVVTRIAAGTLALATSAIASGACTAAQTSTATGAATTDVIQATFNGDPTAVTGYVPSTNGMLTIILYPTTNTVNAKVCNNTASSITPGAVTLNWRIDR